jgi:hypothetical protein
VREAGAHAECGEDLATERDAVAESRLGEIAHGADDRADPFVRARDERSRKVLADVLVRGAALDADRVVRVLLALDELLAARLAHVLHARECVPQLVGVVAAVGVGAPCAGDRLEDEREPDALRGGERFRARPHALRVRNAESRAGEPLLHDLLVAESDRGVVRETRNAEPVAKLRSEKDERLPVGLEPVDRLALHPGANALLDRALVHDARHLEVVGERLAHLGREPVHRRVPDAVDANADLGETARVFVHLRGVVRREEDDVHARPRGRVHYSRESGPGKRRGIAGSRSEPPCGTSSSSPPTRSKPP